jgi:hypothetical protein
VACIRVGKAAPALIRHGLPKGSATGERQKLSRLNLKNTQSPLGVALNGGDPLAEAAP